VVPALGLIKLAVAVESLFELNQAAICVTGKTAGQVSGKGLGFLSVETGLDNVTPGKKLSWRDRETRNVDHRSARPDDRPERQTGGLLTGLVKSFIAPPQFVIVSAKKSLSEIGNHRVEHVSGDRKPYMPAMTHHVQPTRAGTISPGIRLNDLGLAGATIDSQNAQQKERKTGGFHRDVSLDQSFETCVIRYETTGTDLF